LSSAFIDHLRRAHTGLSSPFFGNRCSGANYADNIARGYITVDSVTACNLLFPSDPTYFTTYADTRNILWGDYSYFNPGENFAAGETLVHIEACAPGQPPGEVCPFTRGDYTFYGRYAAAAADRREPLATTYAARYANGGRFDGGTDLMVWRDSKVASPQPFTCGSNAVWFPLAQTNVVGFDEQENVAFLCFMGDNVSPATGGSESCFPLETERVHLAGGNTLAADVNSPFPFGWLYLNLNHVISGDPFPGVAQAWVTIAMSSEGRFEIGYDAIQLDNATGTVPGGVILGQ